MIDFISFDSLSGGILPHPLGSSFPIIGGGLASSIVHLTILFVIVQFILPYLVRGKKLQDQLRPLMLIWSGLQFGINGAGFMVTLSLTHMGWDTLSCQATKPSSHDIFMTGVIAYSGFAYFLIKHLDFGRVIFNQLRRKKNQPSYLFFIQNSLIIMLIQSGVYYFPGGVFTFIAIVDTILGSFINSYYILSAAKYFKYEKLWKRRLIVVQLVGYGILVWHAVHFLTTIECASLSKIPLTIQFIYGALSLVFHIVRYHRLLLAPSSYLMCHQHPRQVPSGTQRNCLKIE